MAFMAATAEKTDAPGRTGLRMGALGFYPLLAQSIAAISPTMTAVLIIPLVFSNAGQGTWLAYAFGTVMLVFVVFCLNQFARRSAAPGAMYTYTARGLGPTAGVFSGWTLIWAYLFIGIAGLTGFSIFCQQFLSALGYTGSINPILFFAISALVCWYVAYKDIRLSSVITLVLQPGRLRECHRAGRRGPQPAAQRAPRRPGQPHPDRPVHGGHGICRGLRHPELRDAAQRSVGTAQHPGGHLQRARLQGSDLALRHGQLLLADTFLPQCRRADHLPDGPAPDIPAPLR